MSDPILVWGAGAIGGTLGAYWARAGQDVLYVDNVPEHVAAMNRDGLVIEGPIEQFTVKARAALTGEVKGQFRRVVLAVKAHHTAAATAALKPHLAPGGFVVSAQNGLNEIEIARQIGAANVMGCFVNFGADYMAPGRIMFGGWGAVVLGELDGKRTPRLAETLDLFKIFSKNAIATDNIWGFLYGKLGYGALLFATALTDRSIADALAEPRWRDVYVRVGREVMAVTAAKNIKPEGFNGFDPVAFRTGDAKGIDASIAEMVAHNRKSAKSHSGIWRDLAVRKRKTEVDAQIAIIATIGREVGVATPTITRLVELIHDIEEGRRPLADATLDALASS